MTDKIVLDLETQKEFSEVEGRKPELLGISLVGIYRYATGAYETYTEAELPKLAPLLREADLLIGFNIIRFDLPVLSPYLDFPVEPLPVLDMLDDAVRALGHRVSLDSLGQGTLGRGKTGSGLDALKWYKEGRMDLIKQYCLEDVRLTKDVYEYGKQHGKLLATSKFGGGRLEIPVFWPERKRDLGSIIKTLHEARAKHLQVEIEYLSQTAPPGQAPQQKRRVDVYHVAEPYFEGYCHLRQDLRTFRVDRVLDIKPTWNRFSVPADFVPTVVAE